jgi:hypothetical protein
MNKIESSSRWELLVINDPNCLGGQTFYEIITFIPHSASCEAFL